MLECEACAEMLKQGMPAICTLYSNRTVTDLYAGVKERSRHCFPLWLSAELVL